MAAEQSTPEDKAKAKQPAYQYIVLFSIAPDQGKPINPAAEGEEPVLVGDEIFDGPSDLTFAERRQRLVDMGAIIPIEIANSSPEELEKAKAKAARLVRAAKPPTQ